MRYVIGILAGLLMMGCSSQPLATEKPMDRQLNYVGDEKLGIRDNQVLFQKRLYLEQHLAQAEAKIDTLKNDNNYGLEKLQACLLRLNDPRINRDYSKTAPKVTKIQAEADREYQWVLSNNNVVGISEEEMTTRLTRLEKTRSILYEANERLHDQNLECDYAYNNALIQNGINPENTKSTAVWVDGPNGYKVWKMTRSATYDVEELVKRKGQ